LPGRDAHARQYGGEHPAGPRLVQQVKIGEITYVCALPLYHIFSLTANCLLFTSVGGTGHLIANPRDFPGFVKELRRHPPMFFMGVNTLFNAC